MLEREREMEEQDVVIVGAVIAGLATEVALKRVKVKALLMEKSEGLRATSAALGLHPNAWLALTPSANLTSSPLLMTLAEST